MLQHCEALSLVTALHSPEKLSKVRQCMINVSPVFLIFVDKHLRGD